MKAKRIDVLQVTFDDETVQEFKENEIIKVYERGTCSRELVGRIKLIDTRDIKLDISDKYNMKETTIKYDRIIKIEKITKSNNCDVEEGSNL